MMTEMTKMVMMMIMMTATYDDKDYVVFELGHYYDDKENNNDNADERDDECVPMTSTVFRV